MSKYINLFFRRISKDFKQKELLPLKLLFFMHSSTILVLYPYLTIHMRELGINVEETAIMSAVTPIAAILMPPLAGMVADKIGNFRVLLAFFSGVGGASALLLLLVPVGRITVTYPEKVVLGVSCTPEDPIGLTMHNQQACKYLEPHLTKTDLQIEACGFVCQAFIDESDTSVIFTTKNYGVQMHDIENNKTKMYRYTLSDIDIYTPTVISETKNHKTLKNNERYTTAVRKLSKNSFFFPTNTLFNFSCETTDNISNCIFGEKQQLEKMKKFPHRFMADVDQNNVNTMEEQTSYTLTNIAPGKLPTKCSHTYGQTKEHISVTIPFYHKNDTTPYKHLDLGSCAPRCIATAPRKQFCSNQNTVLEINMKLTFWSYLSVRVFIAIVSGTSFAMFEGAAIAILREHKADYGLQRIYATIGGMISSPLSGWLIDFASRGKGYNDFSPIFFLYAALKLVSAFLMLFINLEFKTPATSVVSDVISVLKKIEMVALFISCFVLGIAWGYIESFLFWLLQDLGGSKSLMGLTITVGGIVGIPLLVMSGPIIKRLGHANVIFIGFVFYAIRLLGYSLIYNPWLCLIFEAMESITFSLSFTAAVTYAAKLSTVTTDTSIQGMLGGLYYGVGKGAGSLIGGYLIKAITIRTTFQVFSCFTAVTGSVYFLFYHFYMKKRPSDGTDITKKDTEKIPQGLPDIDLSAKSIENIKVDVNKQAVTNMAYEENETNTDINNKNIANNNQNLE